MLRLLLLFISTTLLGTTTQAQKIPRKEVNDIKYKYLELCEFPHYVKKSTPIVETDASDGKKFVIGEIEGSYNKSKLCIIKAFSKTANGKKVQEFYLYEGTLIFVYMFEQSVELYTNEQGQAQKRVKTDFECSYYIKDGKIIYRKAKKEREPAEEPDNKQLAKEFSDLVVSYTKQLSNVKAATPQK